jgi:hypothetical protein
VSTSSGRDRRRRVEGFEFCSSGARAFVARHPCRSITRLPASESLLFAWPLRRRSGANSAAGPQGEGQEARSKRKAPKRRPPRYSGLRAPALRLREAAPGVDRGGQSIHGLTANWLPSLRATLRAFPAPLRRCIGGPATAPPAHPRPSRFPRPAAQAQALAVAVAVAVLFALARRMRAIGVPSIAARLRRKSPKDGPHDVGQFDASPRMDCQRTPELPCGPGAQGLCVGRECGVAFSLPTFLLATQEKVGRSPGGE